MPTEEIKVKITADKSGIDNAFGDMKKSADKVQAESSKAATSIGGVISAVVGAAAVSKITGFFSAAIGQYNTLNAALMRVESTSKAVGQNIERNKKLVQDLADKGFLSLTESANAFSDSISMGLNPDKAKKFVESLSDIAAVERTMGTLNEAVSSGISGLRSGSSERVENIGVSVKKLSQEYQINSQKLGQAAAMEKFYQGVIKESTKYQGEAIKTVETLAGAQTKYTAAVDKAQAAIGKGLEPVMKSLLQTGTAIFTSFEKWFSGLDSTTKGILLLLPLVAAFVVVLGTVPPVLKLISLSNPFGWVAAAVVVVGALMAALNELVADESGEKIVKRNKENAAALKELGDRAKDLQAINKRTASQESELINIKDKLKNKAKELGVNYDELAKKAKNAADMTQMLTNIERERDAKVLRDRIDKREKSIKSVEGSSEALSLLGSLRVGGITKGQAQQALNKAQKEDIDAYVKLYQFDDGKKPTAATAGGGGGIEQRFLESANKIKEIEKNLIFTIGQAKKITDPDERKRRMDAALEDAKIQIEAEFVNRRQLYAEFIEDKYMADQAALEKSTADARRASNQLLEAELKKAGKNNDLITEAKENSEKRLQKIREANAKKQAQLAVDSFAATANAAAGIAKGLGQIRNGDIAGGASSAFSGAAGLGKGLEGMGLLTAGGGASKFLGSLGMAGSVLSSVGGLATAIGDFFGKSDADRARESAEMQRKQEEQTRILELQANYQKSMLALQEANAKLPFENLTRNLRLIEIQAAISRIGGVDAGTVETTRLASRREAMQATLAEQGGVISKNQLFQGVSGTPEGLTQMLNQAAADSAGIGALQPLVDAITNAPQMTGRAAFGYFGSIRDKIASLSGKVPQPILDAALSMADNALNNVQSYYLWAYGLGKSIEADMRRSAFEGQSVTIAPTDASGYNALTSEFRTDVSVAENLLSVIEQSNQTQLEIAGNTKKTAENTTKLADGKGDAIIDIAAGGISQNGAFVQGGLLKYLMGKTKIDTSAMMLNPSIQNAILSTQVMESIDERMARGMDRLVDLTEQEVNLLSIIAANLQSNPAPDRQELRQQILDILEEFQARS